ncbi:MAG TPA: acyltransferase [Kofleriaceae bacterium]|jgi:peptidoglycan/LPS O-acetylase OafA/YrhL|nr:acyltransferase [Kofleriaceae bacterium]
MLYNLHLLRVIAALGVVYFHTTSTAGLKLDWDVGSRGVDVFFVISGFIIAYIATSKPEQFFLRRLIRVVPFYWAATAFVFALVSIKPSLFHTATASLPHVIASLLFFPHEAANGEMVPTLVLGWSLNYEMFFYVWFAISLRISQRWSPVLCAGWLIAVMTAIHFARGANPVMAFYARPIVLEFCYGLVAFYVFQWCSARRDALVRIGGLRWALIAVFVAGLVAIVVGEQYYRDVLPRHLVAGIPSFFVVTSALLLERLYGMSTRNRTIFLLGEASYIIYLVHPYIIFTVLRVVAKGAEAWSAPAQAALIIGLLALVSAIAVAIHVWFEKPVMAFLRARLT